MSSMSCLEPSAFLLASPQQVNPSTHSLAAAGGSSPKPQYPASPFPSPHKKKEKKRKLRNILEVEHKPLTGDYGTGKT